MKTFLFLLKSYPDIDHMAPMIWNVLEHGDQALIVFERPYDFADDYRIELLMRHQNCRLLPLAGVTSPSRFVRVLSRLAWQPGRLGRLLESHGVDLCFVEWGPGIPLNPPAGFAERVRDQQRYVRDRAKLSVDVVDELVAPLRQALLHACRARRIPTIALPHGISTKMEAAYNPKIAARMEREGGTLRQEDRNSFAVWVHNTEREREINVNIGGMDSTVAEVWGSLRFSPEWMAIMRRMCPEAALPAKVDGQLRVVFFLPKWRNNVDRSATIELARQLASRPDVQLVLKTHPRPGTSELAERELEPIRTQTNVIVAAASDHSAALVSAANVVLDIGSGMALDAVLQHRHLIYPVYLHTNRLAFDEWGGCLFARSDREVHQHLDRIDAGAQTVLENGDVEPLVRQLVYGGRSPYSISEHYYTRARELAGDRPTVSAARETLFAQHV